MARAAGRMRPPGVLYHATTPRKMARYRSTGCILAPVRGFASPEAAKLWGEPLGRSVVLAVEVERAHPLPDHHQAMPGGTAWWCSEDCPRWHLHTQGPERGEEA